MERRYDLLAEHGVRDLAGYNEALERGELVRPGPRRARVVAGVVATTAYAPTERSRPTRGRRAAPVRGDRRRQLTTS